MRYCTLLQRASSSCIGHPVGPTSLLALASLFSLHRRLLHGRCLFHRCLHHGLHCLHCRCFHGRFHCCTLLGDFHSWCFHSCCSRRLLQHCSRGNSHHFGSLHFLCCFGDLRLLRGLFHL